jgi:hypothetical protein
MPKPLRLLVFTGSWLATMALLCVPRTDVAVTAYVASVVELASHNLSGLFREKGRRGVHISRIAKQSPFVVAIIAMSATLTRFYYWITWDPVGEGNDDGWGVYRAAHFRMSSISTLLQSPPTEKRQCAALPRGCSP